MRPPLPLRWNLLVIFGLCLMFAAVVVKEYQPYSFLHGDGAFYAKTNRSLLDGTLEQRDYQPVSWYERQLGWNRNIDPGWSNVSLGVDGQYYPKHAIVLPIIATPAFALFGWDGLLLVNVLLLVAALWSAFRIASRYVAPEVAAAVVFGLAAMPVFTRSAYSYSNDVLYAALVAGSIERWLAGRMGWSGLLLGLSIWAKATNAVFALPMGAALLWQKRWRDLGVLVGVSAIPVGMYLLLNTVMFGGPLVTSYHRILVTREGVAVVHSHGDNFSRAYKTGLGELWKDRFEGLNVNASLALLGLPGLWPLLRLAPALAVVLTLSMAGYLLIYAPFEYTYARFFLPWAVLLAVPLALSIERLMAFGARFSGLVERLGRRLGERGVVAAVLLVALLCVGVGLAVRHMPRRWVAADHLTEAQVTRGEGASAVPCDYFNPRHARWECAILEPEVWHRWGTPAGRECQFDGTSQGWLWLHPNPRTSKRIRFDVPAGPLRLRYGLTRESRHGDALLRVFSGDSLLRELKTTRVGQVETLEITAQEHGQSLTLEVPKQPHDWRQICVNLEATPD